MSRTLLVLAGLVAAASFTSACGGSSGPAPTTSGTTVGSSGGGTGSNVQSTGSSNTSSGTNTSSGLTSGGNSSGGNSSGGNSSGGTSGSSGCDGDWTLGQVPTASGSQVGQSCNGNPPNNCADGSYILFANGDCACSLACTSDMTDGQACTSDGSFHCQHIQATNSSGNSAFWCVADAWNMCTSSGGSSTSSTSTSGSTGPSGNGGTSGGSCGNSGASCSSDSDCCSNWCGADGTCT